MKDVNRRQFVRGTVATAAAASTAQLVMSSTLAADGDSRESAPQPSVGAFTKSFQDRSIPEVCHIFKQMGLDGLDLTVRPGGHIDPKDVATKLPEAAQAAKAAGTRILFLTTAITAADADADGVPDGCDVCPGGDDLVDTDGDTVPDFCDLCPGGDDSVDSDFDSVPDACDVCAGGDDLVRSEEHTSELQSRRNLVCRLLLEKKK